MFAIGLTILGIGLCTYYFLVKQQPLSHVPGPRPLPIIGNFLQFSETQQHIAMHEMVKKYGPVFRLNFQGKPCLIVCDFPSIYEVLVAKSADFAGRSSFYLANVLTQGQSGIFRTDAGPAVRGRRKLVHVYLRQYGEGMKRIEDITMDTTSDMIQRLTDNNGEPVNVKPIFFRCISDVMSIMLIGEPLTDEITAMTQEVFQISTTALTKSLSGEIVNQFPFMRFFGNRAYNFVMKTLEMRRQLMRKWKAHQQDIGFLNFIENLSEEQKKMYHISETREQDLTLLNVYLAGVGTTSNTLTILMNVLCQRPDVQEKLRKELEDIIGTSRPPTLADRELMPYHMATLLEVSRYASILAFTLPHKTVCDTTLEATGRTIHVPAGTEVLAHLWSMHHDEDLWPEPFTFNPDRFLDSSGHLVTTDHPNRKHLMPFSAGHRVCVGEVLAMSRMFLVLSRLVQTFQILPESTMEAQPSHDPHLLKYGLMLQPDDFKVRYKLIE